MPEKRIKSERELLEEISEKLNGILLAFALREKERSKQIKILKKANLTKTKIIEVIGPAPSTLRWRKHASKKKK